MSQPELILASGSPRRSELLEAAGYAFRVVRPRDGAEQPGLCSNCGPAELVVGLARQKLDDVIEQLRGDSAAGDRLLLAADTVAECDGTILGKPADEDHARAMMQSLSGREHRVYTGVSLARLSTGTAGEPISRYAVTTLQMDRLSDEWVESYVDSGRWEGKAGGFGYQDGLGFVRVTEGSESNVVGLPMEMLGGLLAGLGCFPRVAGEP